MLKRSLFSLAVALLFIGTLAHFTNAQTSVAKTPDLKTYVLGEGRFSIDLPDKPEESKETDENLSTNDYSTDTDNGSFTVTEMSPVGVSIADDPEFASSIMDAFFSTLSHEFQKGEAEGHEVELGEVTEFEWNGLKGHQLIVKVDGSQNYARVFLNDRIYLMNAISEIPGLSEKVLNSFKIIEKKSK